MRRGPPSVLQGTLLLAVALAPISVSAAQAATYSDYRVAVLQGLDKVTGRAARLTVPVSPDGNSSTTFGDLTITARACRKTPPEELPEAVAFLEIAAPADLTASRARKAEQKQHNQLQSWYSGWMFASDPSLSTLEHPVYDVTVVDCEQPVNPDADAPAPAPTSPAATTPPVTSVPAKTEEPVPEDTDSE